MSCMAIAPDRKPQYVAAEATCRPMSLCESLLCACGRTVQLLCERGGASEVQAAQVQRRHRHHRQSTTQLWDTYQTCFRRSVWDTVQYSIRVAARLARLRRRDGSMVQLISVDVFVPRFAAGARELLQQRLVPLRGVNISFVSVGGASPSANLAFALDLAKQYDVCVQLQLDCKVSKEEASAVLKDASAAGIVDLLLLPNKASNRGFDDVLELVRFVAKEFGLFRISVSGYPRGTKGEIGLYSKDVALTAEQIKAGAHVVLCSPVFDINHFVQYDGDLKRAGVAADVPIQPSLVPLHAFGKRSELFRALRSLGWVLPKKVEADVLALQVQKDPRALAAMGEWLFVCLFLELTRRCPQLQPHVFTMNAAASLDALHAVGVLPSLAISTGNAAADEDVPATSGVAAAAQAADESGANGSQATAKKLLHILHGENLSLEIAEHTVIIAGQLSVYACWLSLGLLSVARSMPCSCSPLQCTSRTINACLLHASGPFPDSQRAPTRSCQLPHRRRSLGFARHLFDARVSAAGERRGGAARAHRAPRQHGDVQE
eukprot:6200253-Pleurochrysis_carterae.AAC.5